MVFKTVFNGFQKPCMKIRWFSNGLIRPTQLRPTVCIRVHSALLGTKASSHSRPGSAEKKPPDPDTNPVYMDCDVAPQLCKGPTGAILQAGQHRLNGNTNWFGNTT